MLRATFQIAGQTFVRTLSIPWHGMMQLITNIISTPSAQMSPFLLVIRYSEEPVHKVLVPLHLNS